MTAINVYIFEHVPDGGGQLMTDLPTAGLQRGLQHERERHAEQAEDAHDGAAAAAEDPVGDPAAREPTDEVSSKTTIID